MFDCVDCIHNKWKGKEDKSYCSLTDEEFLYVTGCRKKYDTNRIILGKLKSQFLFLRRVILND